MCWDALTFKELFRTKLDSKTPATSLAYSHRYFNMSGAHAMLMTINNSQVMAMFTLAQLPPEKALRPCANVAGLVPPGGCVTYHMPKTAQLLEWHLLCVFVIKQAGGCGYKVLNDILGMSHTTHNRSLH